MKEIIIGQKASIEKIFKIGEVRNYSKICNDTNPIHSDFQYASNTYFKKPIVQGLLVASLFGGLLGSILPGKGTIHLGQTLKFIRPVYIGERILATIEVINIRIDKPIITFNCIILNENNMIAIEGEAVVKYKGEVYI